MSTASTIENKRKLKVLTGYKWQGINRKGKKISGELKAANILMLKALLRKQGITPLKVSKKNIFLHSFNTDKKIKPCDIAVLTRQIATMLEAGVPLVQSIDMINTGYKNTNMNKLLTDISLNLQSGIPLSACLRDHPRYFDELYCDLIKSGEQSGALDVIYDRIATYKENVEALKSKLKKALIYPISVLVVATVVTAVLLIFVVPVFKNIFNNFNAALPSFTLLVIAISEFIRANWHLATGVLLIGIYFTKKLYLQSKKFRAYTDRLILKVPIFGKILKNAAIARYARTLATTFSAGVPITDALASAAGASGNAVFRQAILEIHSEVSSGMQINFAMKNSQIFPDIVIQMVAIGEESGAIDNMLTKVANIYEQEVESSVDSLTTLLEPIIMVFLGVVIGGLIIAMYLPIFQIGKIV